DRNSLRLAGGLYLMRGMFGGLRRPIGAIIVSLFRTSHIVKNDSRAVASAFHELTLIPRLFQQPGAFVFIALQEMPIHQPLVFHLVVAVLVLERHIDTAARLQGLFPAREHRN